MVWFNSNSVSFRFANSFSDYFSLSLFTPSLIWHVTVEVIYYDFFKNFFGVGLWREAFPEQLEGPKEPRVEEPPRVPPLAQNGTAVPCPVAHKLMHKPIKN